MMVKALGEGVPSTHDVVLDTCVLMDILFASRPRHSVAADLARALAAANSSALLPAHAYFELVSAIKSETHARKAPLALAAKRDVNLPFSLVVVPIDLDFVEQYLIAPLGAGQLIDIGGGDMIFAAVALKHQLTLVSEDERLRKRAEAAGVVAMDAGTYVERGRRQ